MPFGWGRKKDDKLEPVRDEPAKSATSPGSGAEAPLQESAPGWDALDDVFEAKFPGQQPEHWKPDDVPLPAQDGVWGISGYRDDGGWFYVTYGLTDLFDLFDRGDVIEGETVWSGFGFELTMRVVSGDATPPLWPVRLLSQLGKYVYQSGRGFEHGHRMEIRQAVTGGEPPTRLNALAFARDPELPAIDTPLGRVEFVTVVGITEDELARAKASTTDAVLDELRSTWPTLATDPAR